MTYEHLIGLDFGYVMQCISKDRLLKIGAADGRAFFWMGRRDVLDLKWADGRRIDYAIKDLWTKIVHRGYREILKRKQPDFHTYITDQVRNYMQDELKKPDISREAFDVYKKAYTTKTVEMSKKLVKNIRRMHKQKPIADRIIKDMFDAYESRDVGEPVITIILEGYEPGEWWTVSEYEQGTKKKTGEADAD